MQYNPLRDRKFYVVIVDGIITIATFASKTYFPEAGEMTTILIGFFQAVTAVLLAGYFQADSANLRAGNTPTHLLPKGGNYHARPQ